MDPTRADGKHYASGPRSPPNRRHARGLPLSTEEHLHKETSDMRGILREVMDQSLWVKPGSKPIKQQLHRFDEEKHRAIGEDVDKLLAIRLITDITPHQVVGQPGIGSEKSGKWRVCVDYTSLNKSLPKRSVSPSRASIGLSTLPLGARY